MEMKKPVPNFIFVCGCKVQIEYRGVKWVCSRCGQPGATTGATAKPPWCDRCQAFGHDATSCTAVCRKCGGKHATVDSLRPRTYATALDEFPALPSGVTEQPVVSSDRENEVEEGKTNRGMPEDDDDSFTLDDVSAPLFPFGESDSVTTSSVEHPEESSSTSEVTPTCQPLRNLDTTKPFPARGRATPKSVSAKATKLALPGASGEGCPSAPPTTHKSPATPKSASPSQCGRRCRRCRAKHGPYQEPSQAQGTVV